MTNKSYKNKVYYLFMKSYYQHITQTCSNEKEVRRNYDTTVTDFYGTATGSTDLFNVDPDNFHVSALRVTLPYA